MCTADSLALLGLQDWWANLKHISVQGQRSKMLHMSFTIAWDATDTMMFGLLQIILGVHAVGPLAAKAIRHWQAVTCKHTLHACSV